MIFESSEALNACPKLRDRAAGPISAVCVPVTFMGRVLGVLHASGPVGDQLSTEAVAQLTTLATQSGARIGTVRSFERSQLQASTDGLTGLRNRRTIETELRTLLKSGQHATIVLADLDHFKLLNDTYGHEAGDRALRKFSNLLEAALRDTDLCGRFGGEEFLIVFPDTPPAAAVEVLDRFRARLATTADESGLPGFTASFGIVSSHTDPSLERLLRIADTALYRAKHEGRNRAVVANDDDIARSDTDVHPGISPSSDEPSEPSAPQARQVAGAFQRAAALDDPMPGRPVHP